MNIAQPEDLDFDLARRAYAHTSHVPDERARQDQQDYAADVNGLHERLLPLATNEQQQTLLAEQMERYRQGYLEKYSAYLQAHSRVVSPMIAGRSNFPVARNQRQGQHTDDRLREFSEWRERAQAAIQKALLDARTPDEKENASWVALRSRLTESLAEVIAIDRGHSAYNRSSFTNSIAGKIERLANAGETALVERALAWLKEHNEDGGKPAFTARHKVWSFGSQAKEQATAHDERVSREPEKLAEAKGVELWADYAIDRVQLRFGTKPDHQMCEKLKRSGWRWAPSQDAWQRQLTNAGIASGKAIVAGLTPPPEERERG